jgi:FkbM family methyltransferase
VTLERVGGMMVPAGDPHFVPRLQAGLLVEPDLLDAALAHVRDRRCALDIGAHIGCWTKELATRFGRVVAFEPMPENFAALTQNLAGHDNVRLMPVALADRSTSCRMSHVGRINSGEWHLAAEGEGPLVPVSPLDVLALRDVGLVKIDAEGSEHLVLAGAERTLRACHPVVILEERIFEADPNASRRMLEGWGAVEVFSFESYPGVFDIVMAWPNPASEVA